MHFRISGLPAEHFSHLFDLADAALAQQGALRRIADERPVYPCRVSLTDAQPGDEVILVNYEHHPVASPYRSRFAIYVRPGEQTYVAEDCVPMQLRRRTLALRAYDARALLVGCALTEGTALEHTIARMFAQRDASYLHAHFAAAGCYAARIDRV